jgi:hypothetical protein
MIIDLIIGCALAMVMLLVIASVSSELERGRKAHLQGSRLAAGAAALEAMLEKHGASIAATGSAPGFTSATSPSEADLRSNGFLPSFVSTQMPLGGTMTFFVRVGANKDLLGLACGNRSVITMGEPGSRVAGQIMHAANGLGLRTNVGTPGILNGPGFQGIASPINGPAIICAWAALPTQ